MHTNGSSDDIAAVRGSDGSVDVLALAGILDVTVTELNGSVGMSEDTVAEMTCPDSREAHHRLKMLVNILEHVVPWSGDPKAAYEWYRSQPIPGFGGRTAMEMLNAGRVSVVTAYLDRTSKGGYA